MSTGQTQKTGVRQKTSKMLADALVDESYANEDRDKLGGEIEDFVYQLFQNENTKEYRDKINALNMRIKGKHN